MKVISFENQFRNIKCNFLLVKFHKLDYIEYKWEMIINPMRLLKKTPLI